MSLRDGIADFYRWWCQIIGELVRLGKPRKARQTIATLRMKHNGILVELHSTKKNTKPELANNAQDAVGLLTKKFIKIRIAKPMVRLIVEPDRYLKRHLSNLKLPQSKLSAMASLDMQSATPFRSDDVFLICDGDGQITKGSGYIIVKKTILEPLLEQLKNAGIHVENLEFADSANAICPKADTIKQLFTASKWRILQSRLTGFAFALIVAGLVFSASHAHWRYYKAEKSLDNLIAAGRVEAEKVRTLISSRNQKIHQLISVRNEKKDAVPLVSILEEMSRIIPDSTWLTDIQIDNGKIQFSGFSKSAAALIPLLEDSNLFKAPTFKSPVVRVNTQAGERFTISMQVESENG